MKAKFAGKCAKCGERFEEGTEITYDRKAARGKKVAHVANCDTPADASPGPVTTDFTWDEGHAFGHGPGCYGDCDGTYDCSAEGVAKSLAEAAAKRSYRGPSVHGVGVYDISSENLNRHIDEAADAENVVMMTRCGDELDRRHFEGI